MVGAVAQRVGGGGGSERLNATASGAQQHGRSEARVAASVLRQVVGAHETLAAQRAGELLLARVRPVVAGQLVRPREPLAAAAPRAREGTLACVRP